MTDTDGNIIAARETLADAVAKLIDPQHRIISGRMRYAPSRYRQLRDNLAGTQGDTRTPAKSLPPLWIDATELLKTIDRNTRTWTSLRSHTGTTPDRLHQLTEKQWRPQDTEYVTTIAHNIHGWADQVDKLLDPEAVKHISAPCPACGTQTVYRRDSAGEMVRQPALKLVTGKGCCCQKCDTAWGPDLYLHLCRLLGFELPAGILE